MVEDWPKGKKVSNKKTFHVDYENTPFLQTSATGAHLNRLNWRCEVLLTRNKEAIDGKKILDLASHDGRFSWACLRLGARNVTGVEGRHHLVKYAERNLAQLGQTSHHFNFVQGDVFDYLPQVKPKEFDTILCFGFFYHTIRQIELLREIERIQPEWFILDTAVAQGVKFKIVQYARYTTRYWYIRQLVMLARFMGVPTNIIRKVAPMTFEQLERWAELSSTGFVFTPEKHTTESSTIEPLDLKAVPTQPLVELLLNIYGFVPRQLYWNMQGIKDWTALEDYKLGNRVTYLAQLSR